MQSNQALRYTAKLLFHQSPTLNSDYMVAGQPGGGTLVFQVGYHPRKRTFKTHLKQVFFGYKNRPLIRIFACVFLNLSVMSFPKFVNMTKNTPFFPILHVFTPLNDVRAYNDWS